MPQDDGMDSCGSIAKPAAKESDAERDQRGGDAACAAVLSPAAPACVADREEEAAARPPQSVVPVDGASGPPAATPGAPASGAPASKTIQRAGPAARAPSLSPLLVDTPTAGTSAPSIDIV